MYHGETGQEDFLVVSGECVLVIESEERRLEGVGLRPLPADDGAHARRRRGRAVRRSSRSARGRRDDEIVYPVNEVAARHGSSVETETPLAEGGVRAVSARAAVSSPTRRRPAGLLGELAAREVIASRRRLRRLDQPGVLDPLSQLVDVDRVEVHEHARVALVVRRLEVEVGAATRASAASRRGRRGGPASPPSRSRLLQAKSLPRTREGRPVAGLLHRPRGARARSARMSSQPATPGFCLGRPSARVGH